MAVLCWNIDNIINERRKLPEKFTVGFTEIFSYGYFNIF